jgi:hypothetical protein
MVIRRVVVLAVISWVFLIACVWLGYLPRSLFGPIGWPLFLVGIPIGLILMLRTIVRWQRGD